MPGLIGKKIGMTSIFSEEGKNIPCTILEVGPCMVTQIKTEEIDGYNAVQLGFDDILFLNLDHQNLKYQDLHHYQYLIYWVYLKILHIYYNRYYIGKRANKLQNY